MAMVPQYNPGSSCVADINGMFVGKSIYICGDIHENADRFQINLTCGPEGSDDIALHIAPRFTEERIVRNTRKDGWGREERDGPEGGPIFPFRKGKRFGITITCLEDGYEIMANRYKVYSMYEHRIPFHLVTHVNVQQDFDPVLLCSGIKGLDVPLLTLPNPPKGLEIPFHNIRDRAIVIFGKPTNGSGRFAFNLWNPDENRIHFHFAARLDERKIVRNTKDDGWGGEERDLPFDFPFMENVPFQVKISVNRKQYEVEINGFPAFTFKKRLRILKDIREIQVNGEVEIEKVTFC